MIEFEEPEYVESPRGHSHGSAVSLRALALFAMVAIEIVFAVLLIVFWNYHKHDPSYHHPETVVTTPEPRCTCLGDVFNGPVWKGAFPDGAFR